MKFSIKVAKWPKIVKKVDSPSLVLDITGVVGHFYFWSPPTISQVSLGLYRLIVSHGALLLAAGAKTGNLKFRCRLCGGEIGQNLNGLHVFLFFFRKL